MFKGIHECLLVPVLMYDSETTLHRKKVKSRITAIYMDKLKEFVGYKDKKKIPAEVRGLSGVKKRENKKTEENLQ